ncbi:GNAT family N-acetyltransferase [Winogradskyella sp. PE311]|uniref:GNAT family N-acetyltransferase n=1 Tax=Winogradskyella sp. PE311 TaxID=3366943 RepID=UPI0039804022
MVKKLQNETMEIANAIFKVFQLSYSIEAKLLKATDFPPLKKPIQSYQKTDTVFFGYYMDKNLTGIIEIKNYKAHTDICSLVVHPNFFRLGIAKSLLNYVFNNFKSELYTVETGTNNNPAIQLYKKLGFKETKEWKTDFGIRKTAFVKTNLISY